MPGFRVIQVLDDQSAAGSDPSGEGDGLEIPPAWANLRAHLQVTIISGTSVSYQASLWAYRRHMVDKNEAVISDGSESKWLRLFQTPPGQTKNSAWLVEAATEYDRIAVVLKEVVVRSATQCVTGATVPRSRVRS